MSICYAEETLGDLGVYWVLLNMIVNKFTIIIYGPFSPKILYLKVVQKICEYYSSDYNSTYYIDTIKI